MAQRRRAMLLDAMRRAHLGYDKILKAVTSFGASWCVTSVPKGHAVSILMSGIPPNNGHFGSSRKESANDPKRTLPNKWIVDKKGRRVTGGLSF